MEDAASGRRQDTTTGRPAGFPGLPNVEVENAEHRTQVNEVEIATSSVEKRWRRICKAMGSALRGGSRSAREAKFGVRSTFAVFRTFDGLNFESFWGGDSMMTGIRRHRG